MHDDQDTQAPDRPQIAEFRDYRLFLRTFIPWLKANRRGFSYRSFSKVAGYASPNFLKQVADGKRNLSNESIARFAKGLGLSNREHDVFEALVLLDQSRTDDERDRHYRRLQEVLTLDDVARIEADQYALYTDWYSVVVRELVALDGLADAADLGRRLLPRVAANRVQRSLALLRRLKLVVPGPTVLSGWPIRR